MPSVKNLHQATLDEIKQWFITNSLQYKDQEDKLHTLNWWSVVSVRFVNHEFQIGGKQVEASSVEIKISKGALALLRAYYAAKGQECAIYTQNREPFEPLQEEQSCLPIVDGNALLRGKILQRLKRFFSEQITDQEQNQKEKISAIQDAYHLINNNVELLFWIDSNKRITDIEMEGDSNMNVHNVVPTPEIMPSKEYMEWQERKRVRDDLHKEKVEPSENHVIFNGLKNFGHALLFNCLKPQVPPERTAEMEVIVDGDERKDATLMENRPNSFLAKIQDIGRRIVQFWIDLFYGIHQWFRRLCSTP